MIIDKETERKIDEWVYEHKDEFLADLKELVSFPSVSPEGKYEGDMPFGEPCAKVLSRAGEMAKEYGFEVENMNNYCYVARLGEGEEKVGILGHLDVVPAGNDWNYPPFDMTITDSLIIGRGVMDDKGPLWSSVYAARCLKELGLTPKRTTEIFMGSDEETGMLDIEYYCEHSTPAPVVAFTPDGGYPICHGEKGIMGFVFDIPAENGNIVDFKGGTVTNVVADHAEILLSDVCFGEVEKAFEGETAFKVEKEEENVRIISTGAAVHASTPETGINAIGILAKAVLEKGFAKGGAEKALSFVADMLSSYNGEPFDAAYEDEPSGKLTHVGGVIGFEDNTLSLHIDVRYPVTVKGEDVMAKAMAHADKMGCALRGKRDSKPTYISADSDLVKTCTATVNKVMGKNWQPFTMGGGTYARHMNNAYALGAEEPDWVSPFGPYRGGMHQADECAPIELLLNTTRIYARLLLELDEIEF